MFLEESTARKCTASAMNSLLVKRTKTLANVQAHINCE